MKKVLAAILTLALLISSAFCLSLTASALPTVANDQWVLDFARGQAIIDRDVFIDTSLKTTGAYSSADDAAVFTSTAKNLASDTRTPGIILGGTVTSNSTKALSVTTSSVEKYPIIALKIKLSDSSVIVDRFDWTTDTYEAEGSGKWRPMSEAASKVSATTDWQTIIIDTRNDTDTTTLSKLNGNWSGFRFFFKTPAGMSNSTAVSIAWIGAFASESEATAYDTARAATLDVTYELDFAKKGITAVNSMKVENSASKAFSSEEGVAVFSSTLSNLTSATRSPSLLFGCFDNANSTSMSDLNLSVTRNRIIAVKLKLSDADIAIEQVDWTVDGTNRRIVNNPDGLLEKNTDWQLVCFDIGDSSKLDHFVPENIYKGFRILFTSPVGKSEPISISVEYVRLFETVADAEAYDNARQLAKQTDKALIIDYANENNAETYVMRHNTSNDVSYDYTTSVTRIEVVDDVTNNRGPAFDIVTLEGEDTVKQEMPFTAPVEDYPIIAVRIKLSNPEMTISQSGDSANGRFDWLTTTGVTGETASSLYWRDMKNNIFLDETTDWQTIYVDTRTLTNGNDLKWLSGNWAALRVLFDGDSANIGDYVEIKWAGFFKDMAAVKEQEKINNVYGDANGDGVFDVRDLVRTKRYVAGNSVEINEEMVNFEKDTVINGSDLTALRLRLFKL